jgi:hypothetical protein
MVEVQHLEPCEGLTSLFAGMEPVTGRRLTLLCLRVPQIDETRMPPASHRDAELNRFESKSAPAVES